MIRTCCGRDMPMPDRRLHAPVRDGERLASSDLDELRRMRTASDMDVWEEVRRRGDERAAELQAIGRKLRPRVLPIRWW
jgi:hypothetical protein